MLDNETKRRIDTARDILVGKVPDPKSQVEQITIALIYKFMDDMDAEAEELGAERTFFAKHVVNNVPKDFAQYSWSKLMAPGLGGYDMLNLYSEAITQMPTNPGLPLLFRDIFKNAYLPYRDPETLKSFLKLINDFTYDHSERLGDAFEYLLSVLGSQGDAGQFRTPRHIIDFMVDLIDPQKHETILDPACGTAGFLISAWKHILKQNSRTQPGDLLTPDERARLAANIHGYDISPDMVRLSLVNLYLHGFTKPRIEEYDTLTSEDNWNEYADVILANPPFMSPKGGIKPHKRFSIPSNRSEVLFVDYIAEHLTPTGRAAVIVPEGVIFQSGTAYKSLRETLVKHYLVAVISLPAGIFNPYSGVKTSILLMDHNLAQKTSRLLFAKITNDGYDLGAQRRAVTGSDLPHTAQQVKAWLASVRDGAEFDATHSPNLQLVEKVRISENGDYNLSGERYRISEQRSTNWPIVTLEEVCEVTSSKRIFQEEYVQSGVPFYRTKEIVELSKGSPISLELYISQERFVEIKEKFSAPRRGDILVSAVGTIGISWVVPDDREFYFKDGNLLWLRQLKNILPTFLKLCLDDFFQNKLNTIIAGAAYNALTIIKLKHVEIPLPPLEVQQEIVAEIESYQKIIDGARQVVENYQPRISIHPDWPVVKLGDICKPEYGFTATAQDSGSHRFIRITDISPEGHLKENDAKYIDVSEDSERYILKQGDILVARTGATFGKAMLFSDTTPAIFASYLIRLRMPEDRVLPQYYWAFAQSENYWKQAKALVTGGGQPQFNGNAMVNISFPLPDLDTQNAIVAQIEEEQQLVKANKQLIRLFEAKIKTTINRVWGEEA